jgi:iron complex outermembrane receptor protein
MALEPHQALNMVHRMMSISWKLGWYGSANGNTTTPNYRVENSGRRTNELQFAIKGTKPNGFDWHFFSGWNRQHFGIPNVAHIGNLDDLDESLERGRPLSSSDISYGLDSPKQLVDHLDLQGIIKKEGQKGVVFSVNTGLQLNIRREFDIRRGGRSDQAVADLRLFDFQIKPTWLFQLSNRQFVKIGLDWNWQKNNNISGTGIRPFIPNYTTGRLALFALWSKSTADLDLELGTRIGYRYLDAAYFDQFGELSNRQRNFVPFSALGALVYDGLENIHLKVESGLGYRAPNVAELFASGLHHGASNYELGDPNLAAELGWKSLIQADIHIVDNLLFTTTVHSNLVENYVFLRYSGENTFTIRGAYPVFNYVQEQAWIRGLDGELSFCFLTTLKK